MKENIFSKDLKQHFGKIKILVISRKGNLCTKISIQQISKKYYRIFKPDMYNFIYVDEMKIEILYITNIFL